MFWPRLHTSTRLWYSQTKKYVSLLRGNSVFVFWTSCFYFAFHFGWVERNYITNGHFKWHVSNEISANFNQFHAHLLMFLKLYLHNVCCCTTQTSTHGQQWPLWFLLYFVCFHFDFSIINEHEMDTGLLVQCLVSHTHTLATLEQAHCTSRVCIGTAIDGRTDILKLTLLLANNSSDIWHIALHDNYTEKRAK